MVNSLTLQFDKLETDDAMWFTQY